MKEVSRFQCWVLGCVVAGLVAISSPCHASSAGTWFSGKGVIASNSVYNVNYYVAPASGDQFNMGVPRVQYVNVTGDKATTILQFYTVVTQSTVTASATVAATNVLSSLWLAAQAYSNSVVVVWYKATDTYQRFTITNNSLTTISFRENSSTLALNGDQIFVLATDASLPVGVATKEFTMSTALYNGRQGWPLLMEANGGTNSPINCASGRFETLRTEAPGP